MRQRGYAIAFLLVILLTCAGGSIGGRFVWSRLQEDFSPRPTVVPPAAFPVLTPEPAVPSPAPPPTAPRTPTRAVIPTPVAPTQVPSATATPLPTAAAIATPPPTATTPTPTAAPSTPQSSGFLFDLARPVRHSAGDCPGSYVLGHVTDRAGNPLPNVRLWLGDEYGNEDSKATKSGASDQGGYDFPISGPPRRFYLAVVDASGHPISPKVEILHGLGADAQATCHWVDWQRQ